jgi:excisionase family DNA binding protein
MPTDDMTTAQAAERLHVHIRTVARWAESGRLAPSIKFPTMTGGYLFERAEVERLAAELLAEAEAEAAALRAAGATASP